MSGRAYTMKEMKGIVDHLNENKFYSEYRGRKMWVNFAGSGKTSRTWQSLKETFIKRILPDIHNPYYKLHLDQIRSFRVGEDVTGKPKNKLEIRTVTEDSSNDQEKPSTSKTKEASNASGEKLQASSNRDSVETIILSTVESAPTKKDEISKKMFLRDCIRYDDEPMVPIIRDILHDFSDSDEEPIENQDDKSKKPKLEDSTPTKNKPTDDVYTNEEKNATPSKKSTKLKKTNKNYSGTTKGDSQSIIVMQEQNQIDCSPNKIVTDGKKDASADKSTNNASSSLPDSLLPNNPEELIADKNNISTRKSNETVEKPQSRKKRVVTASSDNVAKVTEKPNKEASETSDSILNNLPKNNSSKNEAPLTPKKNEPINAVIVTTIEVFDSEEQNTEENKLTTSQQSNNPCLQSVSLFAEQLLQANSDSDTDTNANNTHSNAEKSPTKLNQIVFLDNNVVVPKEIVLLESHSDSTSEDNFQPSNQEVPAQKIKPPRNSNCISNLFGSSSAGVSRKRQRSSSHRNRMVNRHHVQSSGSSEWTSESDSDAYVSPPRSRSRLARKCLKPQPARILSLEEHGGLFVVNGKKVFPVTTDRSKSVRRLSEADSDEVKESYWQLKYVEERKKTAELTKLLKNINEGEINQTRSSNSVAVESPIIPTNPLKTQKNDDISEPEKDKEKVPASTTLAPKEIVEEEKTVKIKFAKNNKEVQLEGHWRSLHPILGDFMQIFNKLEPTPAIPSDTLAEKVEVSELDVHKKVDELEAAIFKEIEESDAKERLLNNEETEKNITERRKRVRPEGPPSPRPASARATKRLKSSAESAVSVSSGSDVLVPDANSSTRGGKPAHEITDNSTTSKDVTPAPPKRKSNTKLKSNDETLTVQTRKTTPRKIKINDETSALQRSKSNKKDPKMNGITPQQKTATDRTEKNSNTSLRQLRKTTAELKHNGVSTRSENDASLKNYKASLKENKASLNENEAFLNESEDSVSVDDSQTLYKFPSPETEKRPVGRPRTHRKYSRRTPKIYSSPENISRQSADSSQGYQDSDHSPLSGQFRRKKKFSLPTNLYKTRKYNRLQRRRKTINHIDCDASSESSNLSIRVPANSITIRNSSLSSDVYRSESYQQLMPLARSVRRLEKIIETSPRPNVVDSKQNSLNLSPASQTIESDSISLHANEAEVGSSSNVTLPMSPELSFVETISVNKDTLTGNFPTINETQEDCGGTCDNQYHICDVNVSVPLMEQDCTFKMNQQNRQSVSQLSIDRNTQYPDSIDIDTTEATPTVDTGVTVSQSLLEKIGTVRIETQTTNDSLDMRLGNLLLESAKKIELQNKRVVEEQSQQTDHIMVEPVEQKPKTKSRKRCSTPHKRKVPKKSQPPKDPVIEEQMEFCASGRKSCPPVISVFCAENSTETVPIPKVTTRKPRRAKEIIKVKITKPKMTKLGIKKRSTLSIPTDSGINDTTASILHSFNSSVELIHNHSETCLHAQECLHSSVEFVENSPRSIISLDSSSRHSAENKENLPLNVDGNKSLRAEFYSTDAQDASSLTNNVSGLVSMSSQTAHSGTSLNSLLTDDLTSPPARSPSGWHLLSEDEDTLDPAGCTVKSFSDPTGCAKNNNFGDPASCTMNNDFGDRASCTMNDNFGDPTSCTMNNDFGYPAGYTVNNNFVHPTGCAKTVGYGSNLKQLFPVACAVPDLSTITEQSRETDCNSLGFKMDTNTRNEFLALDLLEGKQEEFFTCVSDM